MAVAAMPLDKLGFVGVGTMNGAIIKGICRLMNYGETAQRIGKPFFSFPLYVSPRSTKTVWELVKEFGKDKIYVCKSNEEVLEQANMIFIGLRPTQVQEVVDSEKLIFDSSKHYIVNLTSTVTNKQMCDIINGAIVTNAIKRASEKSDGTYERAGSSEADMGFFDKTRVLKAVPIPPVQHLQGTTSLVMPEGGKPDDKTGFGGKMLTLFSGLGYATWIEESKLTTYQVVSGLMGIQYQRLHLMQQWLVDHGIEKQAAHDYLANFHKSILVDTADKSFFELMNEQTKGGINEQAMGIFVGAEENFLKKSMDAIHNRLNGKRQSAGA